jgi:hypothetical protein
MLHGAVCSLLTHRSGLPPLSLSAKVKRAERIVSALCDALIPELSRLVVGYEAYSVAAAADAHRELALTTYELYTPATPIPASMLSTEEVLHRLTLARDPRVPDVFAGDSSDEESFDSEPEPDSP